MFIKANLKFEIVLLMIDDYSKIKGTNELFEQLNNLIKNCLKLKLNEYQYFGKKIILKEFFLIYDEISLYQKDKEVKYLNF